MFKFNQIKTLFRSEQIKNLIWFVELEVLVDTQAEI